jgi:hypothetical protein
VKANVDHLTAKQAHLATAAVPVNRLADEATIARYVERLQDVLATGSANARRAFLRAWVTRVEADGLKLVVTFTLPPDFGCTGGQANGGGEDDKPGEDSCLTEVLPRVENGGGGGSRTRVRNHSVSESTCLASGYLP